MLASCIHLVLIHLLYLFFVLRKFNTRSSVVCVCTYILHFAVMSLHSSLVSSSKCWDGAVMCQRSAEPCDDFDIGDMGKDNNTLLSDSLMLTIYAQ